MNVNQNIPSFCLCLFVCLKIVTPVCIWYKSNCFSIPCIIVFTSLKNILKTILHIFNLIMNCVSILPKNCVFIRSWTLLDLSVCFRSPRFCLFVWFFFLQNFFFRLYLSFGCLAFYHGLCLCKSRILVMFLFRFFLEILCFCRMLHSLDIIWSNLCFLNVVSNRNVNYWAVWSVLT